MTGEQDSSNGELEKLKLLYEKNAEQFKFFLTWRQLMLAGYFAIVAALSLAFKWALENQVLALFVFPLAGAWVSFLFWALDNRNRELYKLASDVGNKIEERMGLKGMGHFGAYFLSESRLGHGRILAIFYLGSGIVMFLVAMFLLLFTPLLRVLF